MVDPPLFNQSTSNQTNATSNGPGMEIAQCDELTRKIDRFSLLPNELLDHIFDLAYSIDTPSTGALSKHLLPFHIVGIYRRIRLSKVSTFEELVKEINKRPALATSIQTLELVPAKDSMSSRLAVTFEEFACFIRSLTRLETLKISKGYPEISEILPSSSSLLRLSDLPTLHHLSAPIPNDYPNDPELSFDRFRTIRSLTLTGYDDGFQLSAPLESTSLPLLTHLAISGIHADNPSIASLCLACPSLTHLSLYAYEAVYFELLGALPTNLLHLELGTVDQWGKIGMGYGTEDCSAQLSRFPLLQHLSLADDLFSYDLPLKLYNLRHLESLKLVGDRIFAVDLMELLSPSTRPPSLRVLDLCLDCITIGSRLEVDETGGNIGSFEPGEGEWQVSRDWNVPEHADSGVTFGFEGVDRIRQVAQEYGVQIRGNLFEALEMVDVYNLELANIAIYRCFRDRTMEPCIKLYDERIGHRLPFLDLDALDPERLKLVKNELPDEGWFALSLELDDE